MKYLKYFSALVLGFVIVFMSLSMTRTSRLSEGIYPGNLFPDMKNVKNISGTNLNFADLKGQKVLVVFWTAYNSEARKNNVEFSNILKMSHSPIKIVSVCLDKNKSVFEKTVLLDGLDTTNEYAPSSETARLSLIKNYRLDHGLKNYLINEKGVIEAMNVNSSKLEELALD